MSGSKTHVSFIIITYCIVYSIIMLNYPENREKFIGLGEASSGVGFMVGPGFGGILFNLLGFFWAFMGFASFLLLTMTLCYLYLPDMLNNSVVTSENISIKNEDEEEDMIIVESSGIVIEPKTQFVVDYMMFFKDRRTIFSLVTVTYTCIVF